MCIRDRGSGDVVLDQLPRGEARALVEGPGLVGEDVDLFTAFDGGADNAEGGAVAAGGEGSGVAVGEDGTLLWQELCAEGPELAQVGDVFIVEALGEGYYGCFNLGNWSVRGSEGVVELSLIHI